MTKLLILVAVVAAVGFAVQTFRVNVIWHSYLDAMEDLASARNAARVLSEHQSKMNAEIKKWAAALAETDQLEGSDAPLSDYGRSVLDRVRTP